jgi:PhoH-like ATPase
MSTTKTYFIDTNIILDSAENLETLSDGGQNILIVPETVLSELDAKKNGFEVINYNAREFNRFCEQAEIIEENDINNTARRMVIKNKDTVIHFVSLFEHEYTEKNTDKKILNDRRIIETAQRIAQEYPNMIVLSNDIAFRTHASMMRLKVEAFKSNNVKVDDLKFFTTIELDYDIKLPISLDDFQGLDYSITGFEFMNTATGKPTYGYKDGTVIKKIDEEFLQKQNCVPINIRQKVLSSLMLSDTNDIVVVSGKAGSGTRLPSIVTPQRLSINF